MTAPPVTHVTHDATHRLIASRFPTVGVFDDIADNEDDLRKAFLLEAATNDRHQLLTQRLSLIPDGQIPAGPGATLVMAAFLHANEQGGRFNDARLGAWYAALDVRTAIEETLFHSERRLHLSEGGFPNTIEIRQLITSVDARLIDIRGQQAGRPELYDPDPANYPAAQAFAARHRWPADRSVPDGSAPEASAPDQSAPDASAPTGGIVYDSVRHAGGTSLCLFSPSLIPLPILQGAHYQYKWDASGVVSVLRLTNIER